MSAAPLALRWGTAALLGALLATGAGCGSGGLPRSHAAKGKVVYKDGDVRLLQGATVEFKSAANPDVSAEGEVQADGSFSVSTTSKDGLHTVEGALPGEHRVRVIPPNPLEAAGKRLIDPRFQDFDKSGLKVQVPTEGEIVLEVHKPRR